MQSLPAVWLNDGKTKKHILSLMYLKIERMFFYCDATNLKENADSCSLSILSNSKDLSAIGAIPASNFLEAVA